MNVHYGMHQIEKKIKEDEKTIKFIFNLVKPFFVLKIFESIFAVVSVKKSLFKRIKFNPFANCASILFTGQKSL